MALPNNASNIITNVTTQGVGFAPILRHYFEKCAVAEIIDQHMATDPRRKVLTHGQAAVAMITGILFQVMSLYRICQLASQSTVLDVIYPGIKPEEYFDDRLGDTLDAIYHHGIGDLELFLTKHMIDVFQIKTNSCHDDTTSISYYGSAGHNRDRESITITFGHSKKHRDDLKQLIWSMSVSSDSGFPLFQQAYSGNTADVTTYVAQWCKLIDLLGDSRFLYVGDCKLISAENVAVICDNDGFFLAPAPMYESYAKVFQTALAEHDREILIPYKNRINRGFEVPFSIRHLEKDYKLRMIILFDHNLGQIQRQGLENRVEKTRADFEDLDKRLNRRKLKTREAIEKAGNAILKRHCTGGFFAYQIENTPVITYKNGNRGRPSEKKPSEKIEVSVDCFKVELTFLSQAFDDALARCGYYPLLTNQSSEVLSVDQAMIEHKQQYKNEHTFRRAKGNYDLEPIYLHFPERIEAYLLLFKIALQMVVIIERTARQNIQHRDRGLDDFMPNRKDVRNPSAEYLLAAFQYIVKGLMPMPGGSTYGFVSELNTLQREILEVLDVPVHCFSYNYLSDSS
jgi:transposase